MAKMKQRRRRDLDKKKARFGRQLLEAGLEDLRTPDFAAGRTDATGLVSVDFQSAAAVGEGAHHSEDRGI